MAVPKYITRDPSTGLNTEKLAIKISAGAGDADKVVATDAGGKIDSSFITFPGQDTLVIVSGEALAAGDFVQVKASDGLAYKATAAVSGQGEAVGYVIADVLISNPATIFFQGVNPGPASPWTLTPGARQYLSETPGSRTEAPVTGIGKLHQLLGYATSATTIDYEFNDSLGLAS